MKMQGVVMTEHGGLAVPSNTQGGIFIGSATAALLVALKRA